MTTRFTATVEHGLLRPHGPVSLEDGAEVEVIVFQADNGHSPGIAAKVPAEIAATAMEPSMREFDGRDHDEILYGARS